MAPLRCAAKFDPFLSLDCTPTPSTLAQSKERKGSNFAIWQPCLQECAAIASAVAEAVRERGQQLGKRKLALVADIPEAVRNDLDLLCRQVGWSSRTKVNGR